MVHPLLAIGEGRSVLVVHEHHWWLRRACARKGSTHWTEHFQFAISELRRVLDAGVRAHIEQARGGLKAAAGRLGFDLGKEAAEQGAESQEGLAACEEPRTRRRARAPLGMDFVEVPLGAASVQVRATARPFEVLATPESIAAIVAFCRARVEQETPPLRKRRRSAAARAAPVSTGAGAVEDAAAPAVEDAAAPAVEDAAAPAAHTGQASALVAAAPAADGGQASAGFVMPTPGCPGILGKVTWHPSVKAWSVHYKTAAGEYRQKRVFVKVPLQRSAFADAADRAAHAVAWAQAKREAYEEALALWNEVDRSTRERIPLGASPSSGGAASAPGLGGADATAPEDALGGPLPGVPPPVHARMLELCASGGVPASTPEQRLRAKPTTGTRYGVPDALKEALAHSYLHPDLPAPRGLKWQARPGSFSLVPIGG